MDLDTAEPVVLAPDSWREHALLVGSTGSGKTTVIGRLSAAHLARGHGQVIIDLKADPALAVGVGEAAAACGRPFYHFTLGGPLAWNPLARGDRTSRADKLIAVEDWSETFYKRAAQRYLQWIFRVLDYRTVAAPPTLREVVALHDRDLLRALLADRVRALGGLAAGQDLIDDDTTVGDDPPHGTAADETRLEAVAEAQAVLADLDAYLSSLTAEQKSGIAGMASRLAVITESVAGPSLNPPGEGPRLDLLDAIEEGAAVVCSLDAQAYPELAKQVGALLIQDLISIAPLRGGAPRLAHIVIDEFSALDGAAVVALFARGRSAGLGVTLSTQELFDMRKVDPAFEAAVVANTAIKIALHQAFPESAEAIAAMIGTRRTWKETVQVETASALWGWDRAAATGMGSLREVDEYVIHPNEIKRLPRGQAIVLTKQPCAVHRVALLPPAAPLGPVVDHRGPDRHG